jgi:hypothetical protein
MPPHGVFQHAALEPDAYSFFHLPKKVRYLDVSDGLSQTFLVGEKAAEEPGPPVSGIYEGWNPLPNIAAKSVCLAGAYPFYRPIVGPETYNLGLGFGSRHPGICQFVFCDGRVQSLRNTTDVVILGLLAQRNDGIAIPEY